MTNLFPSNCCSHAGYCGSTSAYCGAGCQPGYGTCVSVTPITYKPSTSSYTPSSVSSGSSSIRSSFSTSTSSKSTSSKSTSSTKASSSATPSKPVSVNGSCGNGVTCKGSQFGVGLPPSPFRPPLPFCLSTWEWKYGLTCYAIGLLQSVRLLRESLFLLWCGMSAFVRDLLLIVVKYPWNHDCYINWGIWRFSGIFFGKWSVGLEQVI